MGEFSKWLLHEDSRELFELLYAIALTLAFLALTALLCWPLGRVSFAIGFLKGYFVFWVAVIAAAVLLAIVRSFFPVNMDDHSDAHVISALITSAPLQLGWSAFAALLVLGDGAGAPLWLGIVLHVFGLISCWVAFNILSAFFMGSLYRMVNLSLAAAGFVLFRLWPAAARALYEWSLNFL